MTKNVKQQYISRIVDMLKSVNTYKVILFGSYAYGQPTAASDIDLLVVTDDDYVLKNYEEKAALHLKVSAVLRGIMKQVPVDLIVYTKPTYERFLELGSMFSKEIRAKGKIIYERDIQRVVESGIGRS